MRENYFPSPLDYVWPIEDALKNREKIQQAMKQIGLSVIPGTGKTQTIELWHPNAEVQAGAIQWGGQDARIRSNKAVAYIVLRFYKKEMASGVYRNLANLGLRQDETEGSQEIRFFFEKADFETDSGQRMLSEIQNAWAGG